MTDPYLFPEGNAVVQFSGGRTSAFMLHRLLEANGTIPDRVVVSFQNTGREMPQTLDFVHECATRWGVRVVWLEWRDFAVHGVRWAVVDHNSASRIGDELEPFRNVTRKRRYLPNRVARFCTAELKVRSCTRYCRSLGWDRWTSIRGLRADEPRRVTGRKPVRERWTPAHPLFDAGVTKEDVAAFWAAQPFGLELPSEDGKTPLGNCCGCFLKSEHALSTLARNHPERMAVWAEDEAWATEKLGDGSGRWFNQRRPVSSLIDNARRKALFDLEGALCQADDGECFD